ncbi:hypothetical protein [Longispora fulva]|uniref:hypothetical protein n=1 Tax=Longispora fulva TaxID=619741 RepID=UPI0018CA1328|nr:hypothetical protein [Longispora fulva]
MTAELVTGAPGLAGYTATGTVLDKARTRSEIQGAWQLDLVPNGTILPSQTHYVITEYADQYAYRHTVIVPDGGPHDLRAILAVPPPSPSPLVPIGGGGAVSSVDNRTGAVTLTDRYSALDHQHDSRYAAASHTHTGFASAGHDHDGRYALVVHAHDYAASDHQHDGRYSLAGHDHDARYALTGHTHTGFAPATHDHDGRYALAAHEHDSRYSQLGHVHTEYAPTSHNHDSLYSPVGHSHTGFALTGHTHTEYAPVTHNHDALYSPLGHSHSGFALTGHTHDAATLTGVLDLARLPLLGLTSRAVSGRWAMVPPTGSTTTQTIAVGELILCPLVLHTALTADQVSIDVSTAAAGATVRLLVYGAVASGQPGAFTTEPASPFDASQSGARVVTLPGTYTFPAGVTWLGLLSAGSGVTLRAAASWHPLVMTDAANPPFGTGVAGAYLMTGVSTPPANFTGVTTRIAPRISLRSI